MHWKLQTVPHINHDNEWLKAIFCLELWRCKKFKINHQVIVIIVMVTNHMVSHKPVEFMIAVYNTCVTDPNHEL